MRINWSKRLTRSMASDRAPEPTDSVVPRPMGRNRRRWLVVVASTLATTIIILALVAVLTPQPAPFTSCAGCPPALLVGVAAAIAPGSAGCADVSKEVCYAIPAYAYYGGFQLSGVSFSLRESITNSSIVPVGGSAVVNVLNSTNSTVGSWSVAWGTWVLGANTTIAGSVEFVLDSGLTSGNLTGDIFWFNGGPLSGGAYGGVGAEL
jgi:hypothetical protein